MNVDVKIALDTTKEEIEEILGTSITDEQFEDLISAVELSFENDEYGIDKFNDNEDYAEFVIKDIFADIS